MSLTQVRREWSKLIRDINAVDHVIVTKRGRAAVVLMSHDDFLGLQDTIEIMSDRDEMRAIAVGERDIRAGRVTPARDVLQRLRV